ALPSAQRALGFTSSDRQWVLTAYALAFGGLLAPSALALLATTFTDPRERGRALGIFTTIAGAGGAVGLLLGGVLTEYLSWRWCLYVNIFFAAAALLAVAGLVGIVYGFSEASTSGWGSGLTIGPLAGGVALLAAFVLVERRAAVALGRLGPKVIVPAGLLLAAAGTAWLTRLTPHSSYGTDVAPALVLVGLGVSCAVVTAFSLGPAGTRPADTGVAASMVNSSNQVGGSLGAALLNTIAASAAASYLASHRTAGPPAARLIAGTVHGDVTAFAFLAVLLVAGAVVTALLHPGKAAVAARQRGA
ncbi:MAG: MFS transporter, partial [Streptosporangiaceae bacterium]